MAVKSALLDFSVLIRVVISIAVLHARTAPRRHGGRPAVGRHVCGAGFRLDLEGAETRRRPLHGQNHAAVVHLSHVLQLVTTFMTLLFLAAFGGDVPATCVAVVVVVFRHELLLVLSDHAAPLLDHARTVLSLLPVQTQTNKTA